MKRNVYQRLLSEYLDGEIGLADKQTFEEQLRRDPALQAEYHRRRRIGLALGSMPEVHVHPQRFRARVMDALKQDRFFISPQRAFSGAMAVALVVVSLSFGLYIYHEQVIGRGMGFADDAAATQPIKARVLPVQYHASLVVEAPAEAFYDRLLLESQLGMCDSQLTGEVVQQTGVLEGATCIQNGGLRTTAFAGKLKSRERVQLTLAGAQRLKAVADGLTGNRASLTLTSAAGVITQHDYLLAHPAGAPLAVDLIFQQ